MSKNDDFRFFPRPEAHAARWDTLLPPVKYAVRDVLLRLHGAIEAVKREDVQSVTNCFLVYGDRGTGKSTVLLSAMAAVNNKTKFFEEKENRVSTGTDEVLKQNAIKFAKSLTAVRCLEVLDLEPLPPGANLLTTLLTRVRDSLFDRNRESPTVPASLFEEPKDGAWHKLQRLINDATLMWEDISEPDTRSRANREVKAADIYSSFRARFEDALSTLSTQLGRKTGNDDRHIILPIDNIDRSTEQLRSIIKLGQMVTCSHLWLVMAGDRIDLDTFLERAYWKELITVGQGAGASGKMGADDEDEAFVMARRQAAAASQKLLPPSHRIEVRRVKPLDTLHFRPSGEVIPAAADGTEKTIYELLQQVKIKTRERGPDLFFVDLLDAEGLVRPQREDGKERPNDEKATPQPRDEKYLTLAAKHGFWLPARSVLDLWQLAHWVANDYQTFGPTEPNSELRPDGFLAKAKKVNDVPKPNFRAEQIARTMLRNVITPSNMTQKSGRVLQEQIIRRSAEGGTILDFYGKKHRLRILRLYSKQIELRFHQSEATAATDGGNVPSTRSTITINEVADVILKIGEQPSTASTDDTESDEQLPDLVAAWLVILHDILMWAPHPSVINDKKIPTAPWVKTSHVAARCRPTKSHRWPAPRWNTFLAHDVFRQKWIKLSEALLQKDCPSNDHEGHANQLVQQLVYGWVVCALETFQSFKPRKWAHQSPQRLRECMKNLKFEEVIKVAETEYAWILTESSGKSHPCPHIVDHHFAFMRDWLERELPMLLSYLYSPVNDLEMLDERYKNWEENAPVLFTFWGTNAPFIEDDVNERLSKLFSTEQGKKDADVEPLEKQIHERFSAPFKRLHGLIARQEHHG